MDVPRPLAVAPGKGLMEGWYVGADRELLLLVLPLPLDQPPYRALLGARVCTECVCLRGGSGGGAA